MNKTEAMELARETGCGIKPYATITVDNSVFFYCQEDNCFKRRIGVHPFCYKVVKTDMDAYCYITWEGVDRPFQASKFTSYRGKTLGDMKHDFFHDYNEVLEKVKDRIAKINGVPNRILVHGMPVEETNIYKMYMNAVRNSHRPASIVVSDDVYDGFLHFDMRDLKNEKEGKMAKVIVRKDGKDVEYCEEVEDAKKWIQKNGDVREKFDIFEKVGTYCVPAPKLKKVK